MLIAVLAKFGRFLHASYCTVTIAVCCIYPLVVEVASEWWYLWMTIRERHELSAINFQTTKLQLENLVKMWNYKVFFSAIPFSLSFHLLHHRQLACQCVINL
jgi:hypothetical protein